MIRVVHIQRRPFAALNFSVERFFAALRRDMPEDVDTRLYVVPFQSRGIARRVLDVLSAAIQRGDVVHIAGDIHFAVLGVRKRRAVLTVLDCRTPKVGRLGVAVYRALWMRWSVRRAARVVAISEFTAEELSAVAGVPRDEIAVIPVPINETFEPQPPPQNERPVVLCFGQAPNKNAERVIEAVRGLDLELRIVGHLPASTASLLDSSGVRFRNGVGLTDSELVDWYAQADVVVFPSLYEGFGMPIVEAQAIGRPVVTSDREPMRDVAGGAACLVNPEDVASIRQGIERVLNDAELARSLVTAGFRNRERFRPRAAAEQYAQIYRELAAR